MAAAVSGHGFARRASPFSSFIDIPISGASKSIKILQVAFRDLETGEIFFTAPPGNIPDVYPLAPLSLDMTERSGLTFRYQMPPSFLNVTVMGVSLRFVADRQFVPNLSCIENYYYNNNLIGSFEFMFGQATCGSVLNWDLVYNLASTMASLRTLVHPTAQLIDLQADTFILTGSELIAHNKVILSIRWPKG